MGLANSYESLDQMKFEIEFRYYIFVAFYLIVNTIVVGRAFIQYQSIKPPEYSTLEKISGKIAPNPIPFKNWEGIYIDTGITENNKMVFCDFKNNPLGGEGNIKSSERIHGRCAWIGLPNIHQLHGKKVEALIHKHTIYELKIEKFHFSYDYMVHLYRKKFMSSIATFIIIFTIGMPLLALFNYVWRKERECLNLDK